MSAAACRAFEERLVAAGLKAPGGAGGAAGAAAGLKAPGGAGGAAGAAVTLDPHAASCAACLALVADLEEQAALFSALARPEPSEALVYRLRRIASAAEMESRRQAVQVLQLLDNGLAVPEPSPEFSQRLLEIPRLPRNVVSFGEARERVLARKASPDQRERGFRRYLGDWRFTVAMAYAAALLVAAVLRIDPLTAARGTASDLTAAGERAIADARIAVGKSALAKAAVPLRERLDYRVYRTVAAGKARAVAYSQLVFEKVFGPTMTAETFKAREGSGAAPNPAPPTPVEPRERTLRS